MAIVWTNDLYTGIDVIDNQHKRIVDYINQLEDAIAQANHVSVGEVLDELVDYTLSHFAFEESLQNEAGYKMAKPHKAIHDMFTRRVGDFQIRHRAGENVAKELLTMLGTWLVHHIKRDDMAYVTEVKENMHLQDKKEGGGGWINRSLSKFFS